MINSFTLPVAEAIKIKKTNDKKSNLEKGVRDKNVDLNYVNYEDNDELFVPAYCHKNEPNFLRLIHMRV